MSKLQVPKFASEEDEAQWYYDHRDELGKDFLEAMRKGLIHRGGPAAVLREARKRKRYAVVIEKVSGSGNYNAYVPDLPGCVAAADTLQEIKRLIGEAIQLHLEGMRQNGEPIPEPTTEVDYVEAPAA